MRNQYPSVTATYRSEIIIKSNWYTLLNILVFDLGPNKLPLIHSLGTNMLEIWHGVFIKDFLNGKISIDRKVLFF